MPQLSSALLAQLMNCPTARAIECYPAMIDAMAQFAITTPDRITCFLTQIKWESGGLVYFAELASGEAYNGRSDLGNTQSGDGPRFKGSGPIQVTGRSNFTQAQQALDAAHININILANPDLARTVRYGFWISCWWWAAHGGNQVAERSPQSYASLCCGRLVNRGDANSGYQAQDESQRVDAYRHIANFGTLSLPGAITIDPPKPIDELDALMADSAKLAAFKADFKIDVQADLIGALQDAMRDKKANPTGSAEHAIEIVNTRLAHGQTAGGK